METLLSTGDADLQGIVYKRYLKWLYKEKDFASCIRNASNMTESHPRDVYGYEWICKIYCENHDEQNSEVWKQELKAPIQSYAEQLLEFNANSNLALLIQAFDLYAQKQYLPARQLVLQAQQSHPSYKVTLQLLARIHMQLGAHRMALLLWQELGQQTDDYAQCLSHENDATKLREAAELLEKFPQSDSNVKALARSVELNISFSLYRLMQYYPEGVITSSAKQITSNRYNWTMLHELSSYCKLSLNLSLCGLF